MEYLQVATQAILVIGFAVASVRLALLARAGSGKFFWFRLFASIVAGLWAVFYGLVMVDFHADVFSFVFLRNFSRTLNYFVLTIFLVWPMLADPFREHLLSDCEEQIAKLREILK